jgi:hypothetical protein
MCSDYGGLYKRVIGQTWVRREMYIGCRCENLKERNNLEDLEMVGRKVVIFKWILNNP